MNIVTLRYDKKILDSLNLPDPYTLMMEGKWTWDAFLDIVNKVVQDTNGDGVIDIWALNNGESNYREKAMNLIYFILSNGVNTYNSKDELPINYMDTYNAEKAFEFIKLLYKTNKIIPDDIETNKKSIFRLETYPIFRSTETSEYRSVLLPKGNDASKYITISTFNEVVSIPVTCTKPKETAILMKELFVFWDQNSNIDKDAIIETHLRLSNSSPGEKEYILNFYNFAIESNISNLDNNYLLNNSLINKIGSILNSNEEWDSECFKKIIKETQDFIDTNYIFKNP
jgi:hypothetical protein